MPKIITHGATLRCTLGVKESNLMVTSQTFRRIADALVGTEGDNKGMVNIPSFGVCKCSSPNPPCLPQPQGWQQTTKKDSINGMKKLTEQSFCMYAKGGRISFIDTRSNFLLKANNTFTRYYLSVCSFFHFPKVLLLVQNKKARSPIRFLVLYE